MEWFLIIILHTFFTLVSDGLGLLVTTVIGRTFEQIAGYRRIKYELTGAKLKGEIERMEDSDFRDSLLMIFAESRMCKYWMILFWIIVAVLTYLVLLESAMDFIIVHMRYVL